MNQITIFTPQRTRAGTDGRIRTGHGTVLLWALVLAGPLPAQEPRFQLDTHGPVGRMHALRFAPGTHRLLGAGADKQTYEWILHTPNENGPFRFVRSHVLRWAAGRGPNGLIIAMDISPDGKRVAIAGRSSYGQGHIWLFDRTTRQLEKVIPAHHHKVVTLRFSRDGRSLASIDQEGHLRLWPIPAGGPRGEHAGHVADDLQPLAFLPDGAILRVMQDGPAAVGQSLVRLSVPGLNEVQILPVVAGQVITALAAAPNTGRWACGLRDGTIVLGNGNTVTGRFRNGRPRIVSLQFGPHETLLMTTGQDADGKSWLELWNTAAGQHQQIDSVALGPHDDAYSCAVSDDGQLAAVYANGPRELWVFPLLDNQGQLIEDPLAEKNALRLFSGQDIDAIEFQDNSGSRLKIEVAGDVAGWEFNAEFGGIKRTPPDGDPAPPQPQQDAVPQAVPAARPTQQGTGVEPDVGRVEGAAPHPWGIALKVDNAGRQVIEVTPPDRPNQTVDITLEEDSQGRVLAHEQLPQTDDRHLWLAVGTNRDAIFAYRVVAATRQVQLVRCYRDHSGRVTHLDASADGAVLASLAEDRLIKLWSLEDLTRESAVFERYAAWGAEFVQQGQQVVVRNVLTGGIAEGRGLRNGDVIRRVVWGRGAQEQVENAPAIINALKTRPLWTELQVFRNQKGANPAEGWQSVGMGLEGRAIVPGWEPMLSMFLDRSGEWAVWMPDGTYNASPDGDELFGWQINRGADQDPDFAAAGQFRERFEDRDAIRRLFGQVAAVPPVGLVPKSLAADMQSLPEVRLVEPQTGHIVPAADRAPLRVRAIIEGSLEEGGSPPRLYVNHVPVSENPQLDGAEYTWSIEGDLHRRLNRIDVVYDTDPGSRNLPASDSVYFENPAAQSQQPQLHLLTVGVTDYGPTIAAAENAENDAEDFHEFVSARSGAHYQFNRRTSRLLKWDRRRGYVTREDVLSAVDALQDRPGYAPNRDVVVFYFAGHGTVAGAKPTFYFVIPDQNLRSLTDAQTLSASSFTLADLQPLLNLPCQKVFVVDACRAGHLLGVGSDQAEESEKLLIRSLKEQRALIVTATADGPAIGAFPGRTDATRKAVNGLFTGLLLEGLAGQADGRTGNGDGVVSLREAVDFVRGEISAFAPEVQGRQLQRPVIAPAEVLDIYDLPLAE